MIQEQESPSTLKKHRLEMAKLGGILVSSVREQACKYVIRCVIAAIRKHCLQAFQDEEGLMRAYGYPGLSGHAAEHAEFLHSVADLMERVAVQTPGAQCSSYEVTVEAIKLLADWQRGHIELTDQILEDYLHQA